MASCSCTSSRQVAAGLSACCVKTHSCSWGCDSYLLINDSMLVMAIGYDQHNATLVPATPIDAARRNGDLLLFIFHLHLPLLKQKPF